MRAEGYRNKQETIIRVLRDRAVCLAEDRRGTSKSVRFRLAHLTEWGTWPRHRRVPRRRQVRRARGNRESLDCSRGCNLRRTPYIWVTIWVP